MTRYSNVYDRRMYTELTNDRSKASSAQEICKIGVSAGTLEATASPHMLESTWNEKPIEVLRPCHVMFSTL